MKNRFFLLLALLPALVTCSGKKAPEPASLPAATALKASALSQTSALLEWQDNCSDEDGYYVFLSGIDIRPRATLPANSGSYTFQDLEAGKTYRLGVQAFKKGNILSAMAVSEAVTLPVPEPEPEPKPDDDPNPINPISFSWDEVTGTELPSAVKLFKTEGTLNGRPLRAWYAVADCSGDIRFRVLFPGNGNKKTIDTQAEAQEKCLVLVNGGIFGASGKPNGFALYDGQQTPWFRVEDDNWDVDRQYWGPKVDGKADGKLHTVSRGLFGVDAGGKPGVYWSYTPSYGTVYVYDQPIPSVEGEAVCPGGTDSYPCERASWEPYNAITCGPVLLQRGKCPINDKKTGKGYWETNYEMWPGDIFGVAERHDRTAVGYLEDGRVVLCVVDGRIDASQGATTLEMAAIMKGLGCVGALNLDGGGSTGMWVKGAGHVNDTSAEASRPVITTLGFFSK